MRCMDWSKRPKRRRWSGRRRHSWLYHSSCADVSASEIKNARTTLLRAGRPDMKCASDEWPVVDHPLLLLAHSIVRTATGGPRRHYSVPRGMAKTNLVLLLANAAAIWSFKPLELTCRTLPSASARLPFLPWRSLPFHSRSEEHTSAAYQNGSVLGSPLMLRSPKRMVCGFSGSASRPKK